MTVLNRVVRDRGVVLQDTPAAAIGGSQLVGNAVWDEEALFVLDVVPATSVRLAKFSLGGDLIGESGSLGTPHANSILSFDVEGNLWFLADGSILKVDRTTLSGVEAKQLYASANAHYPLGLARRTGSGNMYAIGRHAASNSLRLFTWDPTIYGSSTSNGSAATTSADPIGLASDGTDFYSFDSTLIRKWSSATLNPTTLGASTASVNLAWPKYAWGNLFVGDKGPVATPNVQMYSASTGTWLEWVGFADDVGIAELLSVGESPVTGAVYAAVVGNPPTSHHRVVRLNATTLAVEDSWDFGDGVTNEIRGLAVVR
jgi:hypothetical protein